ncbi:hypothetical protein [Nakamurella aerolata]|uniref:Uncharacterized protein n=1 Tax=Nakamurella aerolata TaxID=1656892 RepID=A0A849ACQ1_9ACTN|nr:hypothetical protein [Nakamurella aerolata]NNG37366.1 hypothetical protein [Nakamurella aerolata]
MAADDELVLSFIPPLVAVLLDAERSKGSPLTEDEVLFLRDDSTCIAVERSVAEAVAEQRGYPDIDPDRCWEQWQDIREQLAGDADKT